MEPRLLRLLTQSKQKTKRVVQGKGGPGQGRPQAAELTSREATEKYDKSPGK